jgi:hypothetical protein
MANWQRESDKAARRHGVDPKVLRKLVGAESGGNPNARSPMGAQGLAQFMPATAKQYGVNLGDNRISDDLDGAARYLADNLKRTGGDYRAALSIYNSGKPDGYKTIPETRAYVQKILGGSNPSASPSTGAQRPATRTTTTTSGPSEAEQRSSVLGGYLATRGQPGALLGLGVGLGNIQAPTSTTTTQASGQTGATGTACQLVSRANAIDAKRMPYLWGGGHGGKVNAYKATPLDCSGAVSAVLGIDPRVSGQFTKWGKPGEGDGKGTVIYSNDRHVLMKVNGHFFGTSGSNPGGGAGWIKQSEIPKGYLKNFTARHQ